MSTRTSLSVNRIKLYVPAAALLLLFFVLSGSIAAQQPADDSLETAKLPPQALEAPAPVTPKKGIERLSRLDTALAELVEATTPGDMQTVARSRALQLDDNRVQVQIDVPAAHIPQIEAAISSVGGDVTGIATEQGLVQAWIPVGSLTAIAARPAVQSVQPPVEVQLFEPQLAGNYTTEALAAINADEWHSAGYTGGGVKIGVIDAGFQGYPGLLGSDLPASVTTRNFADGESQSQVDGTTPHGTACAEIIHDVAPDADLYLVKIRTLVDLIEAVDYLRGQNVHIISTSLGFYNVSPGDGTGTLADIVKQAHNDGIFWATAAGNDREAHWGGQFVDGDNDGWHEVASGQEVNYFGPGNGNYYSIPAGYLISGYLRWNDWSDVDQDYDLYVVRLDTGTGQWQIVASGQNEQNGSVGQRPVERVTYVSSGDSTGYGFLIRKFNANGAANFEFFAPKVTRLDELLHARSLANLADAPAAMTVAALDSDSPYPQEAYSSEGPTNGPGGSASGGAIKPDISGYANVDTSSYGTVQQFNGTSAATPHVAGAAALIKDAYPNIQPADLQSFLESRAEEKGTAGKDNQFGHGRLYLGDAPLVLHTLPTRILEKNTSHDNVTDLWAYAQDDYPDNQLTFTIDNTPVISAGVTIDGNRFIDVNPAPNWTGQTDVTIRVTNPAAKSTTETFTVHIVDSVENVYLPLILNQ